MAMQAAAACDLTREPAPAVPRPVPHAATEALARLQQRRSGLFDAVDRQLALLARAAGATVPAAPPPEHAHPAPAAPAKIPEIRLERGDSRPRLAVPSRRLRAAAVAAALIAAFAIGWIAEWGLTRWFGGDELQSRAAIDAVVARIVAVESGGVADAKNKRSSALGLGQFLDETWLDMIRAYRPDLAKGRNKDATLELRREATIAREMTARFAERNAALLRQRRLPVTAGTVYLAHFAGAAGAVALLSAPGDADAARVMAAADASGRTRREQIVKANPFLDRFTVADLKVWAERKMRAPDPHVSELVAAKAKK